MSGVPARVNPNPGPSLLTRLAHFNAKERWWLLRHVMGAAGFEPDRNIVEAMARCVGFPPPPRDAPVFAAMDYHLSWLHAALSDEMPRRGEHREGWRENVPLTLPSGVTRHAVENNQEDVDFILAWEAAAESGASPITWILLIEAKGVTDFSDRQNASKLPRIGIVLRHARAQRREPARSPALLPFEAGLLYLSPYDPGALLKDAREVLAGAVEGSAVKWQPLPLTTADPDGFWYVRLSDRERERWSIGWRGKLPVPGEDSGPAE